MESAAKRRAKDLLATLKQSRKLADFCFDTPLSRDARAYHMPCLKPTT